MEIFECKYCGKICKNKNSLTQHEIRCKENPEHIICYGNKGNMPKHINRFLKSNVVVKNNILTNITNEELLKYREKHQVCEICGRSIEDCVKWNSKNAPKNLCIDHDHKTNEFRGLLCLVCNRQLGWYENNREAIDAYLNKNKK